MGPLTWRSQKQRCVDLSSTEAEYVASSEATKETIWIGKLLDDIGEQTCDPTKLYMDSQYVIRLVRNPEYDKKTKNIDVKYHFIREKFIDGIIDVHYIQTEDQLANILTKPLAFKTFYKIKKLRSLMVMITLF